MNITILLLCGAIASLAALSAYSFLYIALAASVLTRRPAAAASSGSRIARGQAITVLVPAHEEGPSLVDTVRTLLRQDYDGELRVWVLVETADDSSVGPLEASLGAKARLASDPAVRTLYSEDGRSVHLALVGARRKADKLNWALERLDTPLVAFLDADHRAAPHWLSSSCAVMARERASGVQSRRRPLAFPRLTQLWDSAENHVGNEAVNHVFASLGLTVFFTGTSAVFRSEILRGRRFADSLTEDTHLSLDLLVDGARIAYDPRGCTYEEVAPSLGSYIARRRRWATGHTSAYLRHFRALAAGPRSPLDWLRLAGHGSLFLTPLPVLGLLLAQGLFLFIQYRPVVQWVTAGVTLAISLALLRAVPARQRRLADLAVAVLWTWPQVVLLLVLPLGALHLESTYALLAFPLASRLLPLGLLPLLAPLTVIVAGRARLGGPSWPQVGLLVLLYPLQLFFGLFAALLGLADLALGRRTWLPIKRDASVSVDHVPAVVRRALEHARQVRLQPRRWLALPAAALAVVVGNELSAVNACGEWRRALWPPLVRGRSTPVRLDVDVSRALVGDSLVEVTVTARLEVDRRTAVSLEHRLGDGATERRQLVVTGADVERFVTVLPVGFDRHRVDLSLRSDGLACTRTRQVATSLVELRGRQLFLNGEPFVIKGVIPSFSSRGLALPVTEGYRQIAELGANTVRIYHGLGDEVRDAAARARLMVVDQPDGSTWEDSDVTSALSRQLHLRRYRRLLDETDGYPFLLFDNLGNELELGMDVEPALKGVSHLTREAVAGRHRVPVGYSTFLTFTDYPVDVIGINMLDTGQTYWRDALALVVSRRRPFYAGELGGFAAFSERPPTELRISRFRRSWAVLDELGALGGFFYESHDNWAQPVPAGYVNDPLTPDQPDDVRGLWDHENRPKLEARFLAELFADVTVRAEIPAYEGGVARLTVTNRRPYALRAVTLRAGDAGSASVGDLAPGEHKELELALSSDARATGVLQLVFDHSSHHGLAGVSRVWVELPISTERPTVTNLDFLVDAEAPNLLRGRLIDSDAARIVAPAGWGLRVNGAPVHTQPGLNVVRVSPARRSVEGLEWSRDGQIWHPFVRHLADGGPHWLRFRVPRPIGRTRLLLLEGLGASSFAISIAGGPWRTFRAHSYRENILDLGPYGRSIFAGDILVRVDRDEVLYVGRNFTVNGRDLTVELGVPTVFSPTEIELRRDVPPEAAATRPPL